MKIAIIINSERLTPDLKAQLEETSLSEKYTLTYDLFVIEPKTCEETFKSINYEAYSACLIGGGDGTVRLAVQYLIDRDIPIAVLPLGTFNVFATSIGYPKELDTLFAIIKNKKTKKIDVSEVNGQLFLNHAWLGFYYYLLKLRKQHKNIMRKSKLLKAIFAFLFMIKPLPIFRFEIKHDNKIHEIKTCLMFISNSETSNELLNFGNRSLLATGLLYVSILKCRNRWQLFLCLFDVLFHTPKDFKRVIHFVEDELVVSSSEPNARIVLDGELLELKNPLHFINHKNKLNVIVP